MNLLDLTLPGLFDNLALDEALLLRAEAGNGGELLRFWEWPAAAVVLGAGCRLAKEVDEAACAADDIPVARRSSGGGTVLLGHGCLLYSLVLAYERARPLEEISSSYQFILQRVQEALEGVRPGLHFAGTSDLAASGKKFSGNSQQRKRRHLLHHGTLLYDFDLTRVGCYLLPPPRQPEYRQGRDHGDFLTNLPAASGELKKRLATAWGANEADAAWPVELVGKLAEEKYQTREWVRRR